MELSTILNLLCETASYLKNYSNGIKVSGVIDWGGICIALYSKEQENGVIEYRYGLTRGYDRTVEVDNDFQGEGYKPEYLDEMEGLAYAIARDFQETLNSGLGIHGYYPSHYSLEGALNHCYLIVRRGAIHGLGAIETLEQRGLLRSKIAVASGFPFSDIQLYPLRSFPLDSMEGFANGFIFETKKETYIAKTQKGRGIEWLATNNPFSLVGIKTLPYELIQKREQLGNYRYYPVFARPCPINPSHGFVDSTPVYSEGELIEKWEETKREDAEGELILMKQFKNGIAFNGVYANSVISLGEGNDGATSGKQSISIPLTRKGEFYSYVSNGLPEAIIPPGGNTPFYEFIADTVDNVYCVQARSGPYSEVVGDYIPEKMIVGEILKTNGESLIEWKNIIEAIPESKKRELVVSHVGGNNGDHYFVHCLTNRVACMLSRSPAIGETLEATDCFIPEKVDFQRGYAKAFAPFPSERVTISGMFKLSIAILHSLGEQRNSELVGYAIGCFVKSGLALCIGEARYSQLSGGIAKSGGHLSRGNVYRKYAGGSWNRFKTAVARSLYSFEHDSWGASFGGRKWLDATKTLLAIHNSVLKWDGKAIGLWNEAVNLAHNGGWLFNKIASPSDLDSASYNPLELVMKNLVSIWGATTMLRGNHVPVIRKIRSNPYALKFLPPSGASKVEFRYYDVRFGEVIATFPNGGVLKREITIKQNAKGGYWEWEKEKGANGRIPLRYSRKRNSWIFKARGTGETFKMVSDQYISFNRKNAY